MPIEVKRLPAGFEHQYEIIAGETRWRAASSIDPAFPIRCIVTTVKNDEEQFERSIIENLLRSDLPPLDLAFAIRRLRLQYRRSFEDIAKLYKKSSSWIQNYMGVTTLPKEIQAMLNPNLPDDERLSVTVAIALVKLNGKEDQIPIARRAIAEGLSLRAVLAIMQGNEAPIELSANDGQTPKLPKPSSEYASLDGVLRKTRRGLNDYALLQPDLEALVARVLNKRPNKQIDAGSVIFMCEESIALLKKIGDAAKKLKD